MHIIHFNYIQNIYNRCKQILLAIIHFQRNRIYIKLFSSVTIALYVQDTKTKTLKAQQNSQQKIQLQTHFQFNEI